MSETEMREFAEKWAAKLYERAPGHKNDQDIAFEKLVDQMGAHFGITEDDGEREEAMYEVAATAIDNAWTS